MSTVRGYARTLGIILVLLALAGFLLGDQLLGGLLNIDTMEDIVHLVTGALFLWAGFGLRDEGTVRNVVGGLGVLYAVVGLLGFVAPDLGGMLPHGYTVADNIIHLAIGALSIAIAWLVRPRPAMEPRVGGA